MNIDKIKKKAAIMWAFTRILFPEQNPEQESRKYKPKQDSKESREMAKVYESLEKLEKEGTSWEKIQNDLRYNIRRAEIPKLLKDIEESGDNVPDKIYFTDNFLLIGY